MQILVKMIKKNTNILFTYVCIIWALTCMICKMNYFTKVNNVQYVSDIYEINLTLSLNKLFFNGIQTNFIF